MSIFLIKKDDIYKHSRNNTGNITKNSSNNNIALFIKSYQALLTYSMFVIVKYLTSL